MKHIFLKASILFFSIHMYSQETILVNKGLLATKKGTQVSTFFDFQNQSDGNVLNDGEFHFYGDYMNDGLFSYSINSTTSYVVFEGKNNVIQQIGGNLPSHFYNVLFNKYGDNHSFHITNEIENKGVANLYDGVVLMDKEAGGAFIFLQGSSHINTSDKSFINGEVIKEGNEFFKYPIGADKYYRFSSISAPIGRSV